MSKSRSLATVLAAGACFAWWSSLAAPAGAGPTPSNDELYRMILELQAAQKGLLEDANRARAEAAQAREQLETTRHELEAARQQLEARTPAAETPAVSAAAIHEGEGFVREADLPRGAAPYAEVQMLRATDNNEDFAILSTDEGTILADGSNKIIQSKYHTSYKVGAFYSPGGPRDFAFSYQGFEDKDDARLAPPFEHPDGNDFVTLIATLPPPGFGQVAVSANAKDDFRYSSIDAEVGENLRVGEKLALRLFAGIRYTNMNEHFKAYYFGGDFDPVNGARSNFDFGFWGVGPRVGAGWRYPLPWGFNLFGQTGVSLLVGEQEAESGFVNPFLPDVEDEPLDAFVHRDYGVRVIPALDMRAGLGWEHLIGEWGSFFVDAGYEFQNYFGAVEQLTWGPEGSTGDIGESTGDFGIDGVFVRGGFRFNGP